MDKIYSLNFIIKLKKKKKKKKKSIIFYIIIYSVFLN